MKPSTIPMILDLNKFNGGELVYFFEREKKRKEKRKSMRLASVSSDYRDLRQLKKVIDLDGTSATLTRIYESINKLDSCRSLV